MTLRVRRILERYFDGFETLQRSPIHNPKRKVYHTRIDQEKRLVDEPLGPSRPNEIAILYVDHHEAANDWASHYRGDTLGMIEKAVRLDLRNRQWPMPTLRPAKVAESTPYLSVASISGLTGTGTDVVAYPTGSFGEYISNRKLRKLGVSPDMVEAVLWSGAGADLEDSGISTDIAESVYAWYYSKVPLPHVPRPVPALEAADALPLRTGEMATVFSSSLSQLLSVLTDEQRSLARRANRGLYVIKGAAGSGKTIVGVRRIEFLREQHQLFDRPILFICYNKVLANAARQMIEDTLGESLESAGVEVWAAYEMMGSLQSRLGVTPPRDGYRSPEALLPILALARKMDTQSALQEWSDRALLDEILEVIYGRKLETLDEYRATNRRGRGRALRKEGRPRAAIWDVYKELVRLCDKRGVAPWDELPVRIARRLHQAPLVEPTYSAIVVDEAQDLLPVVFQVLLGLQAGSDENMLVLGDAAQNIYRSGFRWGHTGLQVLPGQVTYLRNCFRSTSSIIAAALPLIERQRGRLEGDLVVPEGSGDAGPPVSITYYTTAQQELDDVAVSISDRIAEGVSPSTIAVLVDDTATRAKVRDGLTTLEVRSEDFMKGGTDRRIDIFEQSVKLLAVASAKGMEFQQVYIPTITAGTFPAEDRDGESADRARRTLYTAMTRGAWKLHLSAHGEPSPLLRELDSSRVVVTDRRSSPSKESAESSAVTLSPPPSSPSWPIPEVITAVDGVMQRSAGVAGGPSRFRESGWVYQGQSAATCPDCVESLHVLRKPYTSAGRQYRYWAIVCPRCETACQLSAFDKERQKLIRRTEA